MHVHTEGNAIVFNSAYACVITLGGLGGKPY